MTELVVLAMIITGPLLLSLHSCNSQQNELAKYKICMEHAKDPALCEKKK